VIVSFALTALAQQPSDWQFVGSPVLEPDPAITFMSQSIGAPSVVYDTIRGRFFMVFETRTPTVDARCPQGVWGIGAATSTDGINWTPFATPILEPTPGNGRFYSCVAAHPSAMFFPNNPSANGGIVVVFKGEQDTDACDVITPSWGCDTATGFGRIQIALDAAGDPSSITIRSRPIYQPAGNVFGYPKIVRDGTMYHMLYQDWPDIWSVEGTNLLGLSSPDIALDVSDYNSTLTWVEDEFYNPSLVCDDDPAFPYATFVGGRSLNATGSAVLLGGWGKGIDDIWGDANQFLLDATPQQDFANNDDWRHFEVTKLSTGEYLVWYSEKDVSGNSSIYMGGTTLSFNNSDVVSRVCP
jgi:hypothetical protein